MKISDRIFELIKDRGMTQKDFSDKTGIPQSTISDWKSKGLNPASDKIMIISQVLQVSVYDLLASADKKEKYSVDYICIDYDSKEKVLIEIYRALPESKRERLMGYAEALKSEQAWRNYDRSYIILSGIVKNYTLKFEKSTNKLIQGDNGDAIFWGKIKAG